MFPVFFHKIYTRTYVKTLRQCSRHMGVFITCGLDFVIEDLTKLDIQVKKILAKSRLFTYDCLIPV